MHHSGRQSMFLLLGNAQSFLLVGYIGAVGALGDHRRCTCPYVDRQCLWGKPRGATWSRQFVTALLGFLLFLIMTFFGSSATGLLSAPTFGLWNTKDQRVSSRSLENKKRYQMALIRLHLSFKCMHVTKGLQFSKAFVATHLLSKCMSWINWCTFKNEDLHGHMPNTAQRLWLKV